MILVRAGLFFLLVTVGLAQRVYLKAPGSGVCYASAATNTTPIRLTVSNTCGLTNGAIVLVNDVRGNTGANSRVSVDGEVVHLARKVSNLIGSSFDLLDMANNPVPGSIHASCAGPPSGILGTCAYSGGGRVTLAVPFTAPNFHPIMHYDGPAGPRTAALDSARAVAGNPSFNGLMSMASTYASTYGSRWGYENWNGAGPTQGIGVYTLASALKWRIQSDTAARDAAVFGIVNADQILGTPACLESDHNCATPPSQVMDYPLQFSQTIYQAYSILRASGSLSAPQILAWRQFMLGDLPWSQGGINITGTALVKPAFTKLSTTAAGTIALVNGAFTVTGTGTNFAAQCAVGGILTSHLDVYGHSYKITAITPSPQTLTVEAPIVETGAAANFSCGPRWDSTMYGFLWHQKHQDYNPNNGSGPTAIFGDFNGGVISPFYGALSGFYQNGFNNHSIVRALGMFALGAVTCEDDTTGCLLLQQADEYLADVVLPYTDQIWTGFSWAGNTYHQQRITGPLGQWRKWRMNSIPGAADPLAGRDTLSKAAEWNVWSFVPRWNQLPAGEQSWVSPDVFRLQAGMNATPGSAGEALFMWWFRTQGWYNAGGGVNTTRTSYDAGSAGYGGSAMLPQLYLEYDPAAAQLAPTITTKHFHANNSAACLTQFDTATCTTAPDVRRVSISRDSWADNASYVAVNQHGRGCRDHCADELGGYLYIFRNRQALLANDTAGVMGSSAQRSYPQVGAAGVANLELVNYYDLPPLRAAGDNDFMLTSFDMTLNYKAAANVTSMKRQVLHLKKNAGATVPSYVIDHVKGAFASAQPYLAPVHYNLNGCGVPSSTSCVSLTPGTLSASHIHTDAGASARLNSLAFGISGPIFIATETGSAANGSYTGGGGASFRWHLGFSAGSVSAAEHLTVHQVSGDPATVMPVVVQSSNGIFRSVEIKDPMGCQTAAFTADGSNASIGAALVTTHSGTCFYVVSGLTSGTYEVLRNGVNVVPSAVTTNNTISFSALSGSIIVQQFGVSGGVPSIDTVSLPGGVFGAAYSSPLAASGGFPPYVWSVASGSALPPGLSVGLVSGIISGVPTLAGANSFTMRVTDSALQTATRAFSMTVGAARVVRVSFRRPLFLATADTLYVEYGAGALSSSASLACSASCTLAAGSYAPGVSFQFRARWRAGAVNLTGFGRTKSVVIP